MARHAAALDRIFFDASSVRSFDDESARRRFRERWLGRYLGEDDDPAFVALPAGGGDVIGYVVGALVDPAISHRFGDISYFAGLTDVTAAYPAHLHINVDRAWRSVGVGAGLVEAFASRAREAGAPGVHVVTGEGMRNVGFYQANGFHVVRRFESDGRPLVMLGRRL